MEFDSGEADHALLVYVPLIVLEQLAARAGNGLEEGINWRRSAPVEIVVILPHQIPEPARVAGFDVANALPIPLCDDFHFALAGGRGQIVAVAAADVSHVNAQYPQEPIAFARRDFS